VHSAPKVGYLIDDPDPAPQQEHPEDQREPAAVPVQVRFWRDRRRGVDLRRELEVFLPYLIPGGQNGLARPQNPGDEADDRSDQQLSGVGEGDLIRRPLHDDRRGVNGADAFE